MYFTTFQMDSLATKMIQFSKIPGSYALECDSTDALTDYTLRLVDMVWCGVVWCFVLWSGVVWCGHSNGRRAWQAMKINVWSFELLP